MFYYLTTDFLQIFIILSLYKYRLRIHNKHIYYIYIYIYIYVYIILNDHEYKRTFTKIKSISRNYYISLIYCRDALMQRGFGD